MTVQRFVVVWHLGRLAHMMMVQEEVADREAHRKEMMALIAKRMHRKGSQPAFRAAPVQHLPMQQLHASGDGRIDASAANEGRLDTATALDRNRIFECVGIHKIPVEVGGQAKDIDINSCTDLRAFYEAVKNKFGQQIKPEVGDSTWSDAIMSSEAQVRATHVLWLIVGYAADIQCVGAHQRISEGPVEQDDTVAALPTECRASRVTAAFKPLRCH